jgi:hypothetical protein
MHHIFTTAQSQLSHWCQLVGGIPTPLKNLTSSVGIIIPNIWTVMIHSCSKPPTSIHIYIYIPLLLDLSYHIPIKSHWSTIYNIFMFQTTNQQSLMSTIAASSIGLPAQCPWRCSARRLPWVAGWCTWRRGFSRREHLGSYRPYGKSM